MGTRVSWDAGVLTSYNAGTPKEATGGILFPMPESCRQAEVLHEAFPEALPQRGDGVSTNEHTGTPAGDFVPRAREAIIHGDQKNLETPGKYFEAIDSHLSVINMQPQTPHLRETSTSKQLIVNGKPFLMLAAELQNSSLTSAKFMREQWPKLVKANINTVLGCVTWEQIEPTEGTFDFHELDRCIEDLQGGARFLLIGKGFQVRFAHESAPFTGILSFAEEMQADGSLKTLRMLNGDESRSGKFCIMPNDEPDYGGFPICVTIPARRAIAEAEAYALEEHEGCE
ncbi:hypothetical protein LTR09_006309 [Extremus antarcticus]|uniref:Uncharacterized protein n=1 Tax=Extremus antarcticus TaxID=702011 RepID=A0AAJ0GBS4_9PEZI|nr:hypothetical protein LTR09_006309 [Extremus antarcticus]